MNADTPIRRAADAVTRYVDLNRNWNRQGIEAEIKRELEKAVPALDENEPIAPVERVKREGHNECRKAFLGAE